MDLREFSNNNEVSESKHENNDVKVNGSDSDFAEEKKKRKKKDSSSDSEEENKEKKKRQKKKTKIVNVEKKRKRKKKSSSSDETESYDDDIDDESYFIEGEESIKIKEEKITFDFNVNINNKVYLMSLTTTKITIPKIINTVMEQLEVKKFDESNDKIRIFLERDKSLFLNNFFFKIQDTNIYDPYSDVIVFKKIKSEENDKYTKNYIKNFKKKNIDPMEDICFLVKLDENQKTYIFKLSRKDFKRKKIKQIIKNTFELDKFDIEIEGRERVVLDDNFFEIFAETENISIFNTKEKFFIKLIKN